MNMLPSNAISHHVQFSLTTVQHPVKSPRLKSLEVIKHVGIYLVLPGKNKQVQSLFSSLMWASEVVSAYIYVGSIMFMYLASKHCMNICSHFCQIYVPKYVCLVYFRVGNLNYSKLYET